MFRSKRPSSSQHYESCKNKVQRKIKDESKDIFSFPLLLDTSSIFLAGYFKIKSN